MYCVFKKCEPILTLSRTHHCAIIHFRKDLLTCFYTHSQYLKLLIEELSTASYYFEYDMLIHALGRDIDRRLNYFTKTYTDYIHELYNKWCEYINFLITAH